ncbi:MAG: NADPH-dependent F420 reductase [Halobacteriales archaeon]
MHVAIMGTGTVGETLARALTEVDHDVVLGSRSTGAADATLEASVDVRSHASAIEGADAVVLAVPPAAAVELAERHAGALADLAVVDPTNEYPDPADDLAVAERIAAAAPEAHVAKAFNTIGAEHMADPSVGDGTATMFVAGDDDPGLETATALATDLGFDPFVAGDLEMARHLENLGRLWIDLSIEHGRDVAFRLLRG